MTQPNPHFTHNEGVRRRARTKAILESYAERLDGDTLGTDKVEHRCAHCHRVPRLGEERLAEYRRTSRSRQSFRVLGVYCDDHCFAEAVLALGQASVPQRLNRLTDSVILPKSPRGAGARARAKIKGANST